MKVTQTERTTDEFIALIDNMFLDKYTQDKLDKLIATEKPIITQHLFLRT